MSVAEKSVSSLSRVSTSTASSRRERQQSYGKSLVNCVQHVDCRGLYKILMKLEKPFRGAEMKKSRQRLIMMLYLAACDINPQYNEIIEFIKQEVGIYVSVIDTRQLVLYCGLFGPQNCFSPPTNNEVCQVIRNCPLSVPPFQSFKRWSREIKRMENSPLLSNTKGYFSSNMNNESVSIDVVCEDHSALHHSFTDRTEEMSANVTDDGSVFSDSSDDTESTPSSSPIPSTVPTMQPSKEEMKIVLEKKLSSGEYDIEDDAVTAKRNNLVAKRKKAVLNLYERSDDFERNKMMLALSRGEKKWEEAEDNKSELSQRFSRIFTAKIDFGRFDSIPEADSSDDCSVNDNVAGQDTEEMKIKNEKEKKKIANLSRVISLRPSLAKNDIMKKLRKRKIFPASPEQCNSSATEAGPS